jgi:hypothetical protein
MSHSWHGDIYNGLSVELGITPKVSSNMITKSRFYNQESEIVRTEPIVVSDHRGNNALRKTAKSKQKFSSHRAMSFLPQE